MKITSINSARQKSELEHLNNFAILLLQQRSLEDLCWAMADAIGKILNQEDCIVYLRQGNNLVQMAAIGVKNPVGRQIKSPTDIKIGEGIVGNVALRAKAELVGDTRSDSRYINDEFSGKSELAVPVIYANEVIAVIDSESLVQDGYSEQDLKLLTSLANIASSRIATAIEQRDKEFAQQQLRRMNDELEIRIRERTEKLQMTIAQLQNEMDERQKVEAALYREKEHLAVTLRSIADGVIAIDEKNQIMFMSKSAELLTGRSMSNSLQLENIYITQKASLQNQSDDGLFLLDRMGQDKILISESRSPIYDDHQGYLGTIISFRDVGPSMRKQAESELDSRLTSLGELAGSVAHNFNNALTIITGNLEIALAKSKDGGELRGPLSVALDVSKQASALPRQLYQFANGNPLQITKNYQLRPLLEDAVTFYLTARDIPCVTHFENSVATVDIDEQQIQLVIGNLLTNARRAVSKGGKVEVSLLNLRSYSKHWIQIEVRDSGTTLTKEETRRLFEPSLSGHFRSDWHSLAESYGIIKRHGGALQLTTEGSEGNRFRLLLPVSQTENTSGNREASGATALPMRILLMDDDPMICEVSAQMLDIMGHSVATVTHGDAAISEYVRAKETGHAFDIAILDMTIFGGLGGIETLNRIRQYDPDAKCILMTGQMSQDAIASRDIGPVHRLQKPFGAALLQQTINNLMSEH